MHAISRLSTTSKLAVVSQAVFIMPPVRRNGGVVDRHVDSRGRPCISANDSRRHFNGGVLPARVRRAEPRRERVGHGCRQTGLKSSSNTNSQWSHWVHATGHAEARRVTSARVSRALSCSPGTNGCNGHGRPTSETTAATMWAPIFVRCSYKANIVRGARSLRSVVPRFRCVRGWATCNDEVWHEPWCIAITLLTLDPDRK